MKRWVVATVLTVVLLGIAVVLNLIVPERLTEERIQASERAVASLEEVEALRERIDDSAAARGSSAFRIRFECSNGEFIVECSPEWAPQGAARLREAIEQGVYNDAYFFRVVPGFIVQFGIPGDPGDAAKWRNSRIQDDPVKESNVLGTLTFATSGPNSRTTQLFINLADNPGLDARGFAPVGRVVEGMGLVESINAEYGQTPDQSKIQTMGNAYLKSEFPNMDYIKRVEIIGPEGNEG